MENVLESQVFRVPECIYSRCFHKLNATQIQTIYISLISYFHLQCVGYLLYLSEVVQPCDKLGSEVGNPDPIPETSGQGHCWRVFLKSCQYSTARLRFSFLYFVGVWSGHKQPVQIKAINRSSGTCQYKLQSYYKYA